MESISTQGCTINPWAARQVSPPPRLMPTQISEQTLSEPSTYYSSSAYPGVSESSPPSSSATCVVSSMHPKTRNLLKQPTTPRCSTMSSSPWPSAYSMSQYSRIPRRSNASLTRRRSTSTRNVHSPIYQLCMRCPRSERSIHLRVIRHLGSCTLG